MVSRRAYKEPRSPFNIITWLMKLRETELDPLIVDTFVKNMPNELVDKPVMLSNGEIGAIHAIDPDDIEYPHIRMNGQVIKTSKELHCTYMYFEEKEEVS
jgi:HD-GYP domain-containing protein (c-di-GMP phosphodiesterase class II)